VPPSKDYSAIAASKIVRPADIQRRPKLFVYGRNKKGKTTFCTSVGVDKVLIADPEHGTDEMKKKNPHVWPIEQWEDIEEYYQYLRSGKHEYTWAALDGLSRMSNMALRYVMKVQEERSLDRQPGMVQQRDYGKSGELMRQMLTNFHNLPMGVIYTAQERMESSVDMEEDEESEDSDLYFVPDLPKGVRGMANSLVDVIGRIYVVKLTDGKKERRLWLGESIRYDTGYRSDYTLPDMIKNPTVPRLVTYMRTGKPPAKKSASTRKKVADG
jgi:hypothetical protein